ncbi:MAG: hypothetical protein IKJ74_05310 [Clostridia bacterium]|nr:hypothetical protein [Clostridia bacterium]
MNAWLLQGCRPAPRSGRTQGCRPALRSGRTQGCRPAPRSETFEKVPEPSKLYAKK